MLRLVALLCCLLFFASYLSLAVAAVVVFLHSPLAPRHWLASAIPVAGACLSIALHIQALHIPSTRTMFTAKPDHAAWCRPQHIGTVETVARQRGTACTMDDFAPVTVPARAPLERDDAQHRRLFQNHGSLHATATCAQARVACFLWSVRVPGRNASVRLSGHATAALHVQNAEAVYAVPSFRIQALHRQNLPGPFHLSSAAPVAVSPRGRLEFDDAFYAHIPHQWMVGFFVVVPARVGAPVGILAQTSPVCTGGLPECDEQQTVSEFIALLSTAAAMPRHLLLALLAPVTDDGESEAGVAVDLAYQAANVLFLGLLLRQVGLRAPTMGVGVGVLSLLCCNWVSVAGLAACSGGGGGVVCRGLLLLQGVQAVLAGLVAWWAVADGGAGLYTQTAGWTPACVLFPWLLLEGTVFVRAAVMVAVMSAGCVVRGVWREVSRCELGNEDV